MTSGTEVYTSEGFKAIEQVDSNQEVIVLDEKNKGKFQKIETKPAGKEQSFKLKNQRGGIDFDFPQSSEVFIKGARRKIAELNNLKIKDLILCGNGWQTNYISTKYTHEDIQLLSWIVGDGSIKCWRERGCKIEIGLKKERKINRLKALLEKMNTSYYFHANKKQTTFTLRYEEALRFLKVLNYTKHIPRDWAFLSHSDSKVAIEELIQVDGDYTNFISRNTFRLNSVETENLEPVQIMAAMNLGKTSITERTIFSYGGEIITYYLSMVPKNRLEYCRSGMHNRSIDILNNLEERNTYSVEIENNNHKILIRQDGKIIFI